MLGILLTHVTGVESNVMGGISKVLNELETIGHHVRIKSGVQPAHVLAATSTPSDPNQKSPSQGTVGDGAGEVATPLSEQKRPVQHTSGAQGAELEQPILVDDLSSHSRDNKATSDGRICTRDSPAGRVHSQPQMRVVPFADRLLGVASPASIGEASASVVGKPTPSATKYKDPPGYEGVTDFGCIVEPYFKPPTLVPKKIGVSGYLTRSLH